MSNDKPATKSSATASSGSDSGWGIAIAAVILMLTASHISHDWLYLACLSDGHKPYMCEEWTGQDRVDVDGRTLADIVVEALASLDPRTD